MKKCGFAYAEIFWVSYMQAGLLGIKQNMQSPVMSGFVYYLNCEAQINYEYAGSGCAAPFEFEQAAKENIALSLNFR